MRLVAIFEGEGGHVPLFDRMGGPRSADFSVGWLWVFRLPFRPRLSMMGMTR